MQHGLQHVIRLVNLFPGHSLDAQLVTATCFTAFFSGQRVVIRHVGFRFFQRFLIARLVDGEQHLIFFHQLVIVDVDCRNETGDIGRYRDHLRAETRIARPRGFGVINPGAKNSDERQDDQRHSDGSAGDFSC